MRRVTCVLACAALCACGGGGGGYGGGSNNAPSFTSSGAVSVSEGTTGTFYQATATDPNGDALAYSISGGADAGDFSITQGGALSFVATPDFGAPADANGDNVYLVTLQVSDGAATATLALTVTVTDGGGPMQARKVNGVSFQNPVFLTGLPDGTGRVLVVEQQGYIWILDPATGVTDGEPFADLRSRVDASSGGLLGLALAPDYPSSGEAYVFLNPVASDGHDIDIVRYVRSAADPDTVDDTVHDLILHIPEPNAQGVHHGGWLGFGPDDGLLYIAVGDGGRGDGAAGDGDAAQDAGSLLGKIPRIDVSADDFESDDNADYSIPPSNTSGTEVWATGFRNPFRASFDPVTGDLWVGDVGQFEWEEIDRLDPSAGHGGNFGWPYFEGTHAYAGGGTPPGGFSWTPPVTEYPHIVGVSVTGGVVYRGAADELRGEYIFADWGEGVIWSTDQSALASGSTLPIGSLTERNADLPAIGGSIGSPVAFGVDALGEVYIVDFFGGGIFLIEEQ